MFGQIGATGRNVTGNVGQKWPNFENFVWDLTFIGTIPGPLSLPSEECRESGISSMKLNFRFPWIFGNFPNLNTQNPLTLSQGLTDVMGSYLHQYNQRQAELCYYSTSTCMQKSKVQDDITLMPMPMIRTKKINLVYFEVGSKMSGLNRKRAKRTESQGPP